jgi:hypothetical protein
MSQGTSTCVHGDKLCHRASTDSVTYLGRPQPRLFRAPIQRYHRVSARRERAFARSAYETEVRNESKQTQIPDHAGHLLRERSLGQGRMASPSPSRRARAAEDRRSRLRPAEPQGALQPVDNGQGWEDVLGLRSNAKGHAEVNAIPVTATLPHRFRNPRGSLWVTGGFRKGSQRVAESATVAERAIRNCSTLRHLALQQSP